MQCTPLRLAPSTLALSLEAVSRTSLERTSWVSWGLRGQHLCPAQGFRGGLLAGLHTLCLLGLGRGIWELGGWAPRPRSGLSRICLLHLAARNLAVHGLCPKGGDKIPSAGTSLAV